ncbi:HAD domain-containing protein [Acidovorax sp. FG27]|uniref:HAD domain-containing protein n=1 Tax=Acidovorax sp. FG27 TaxID=3133652 RepID=UPI0030E8EF00
MAKPSRKPVLFLGVDSVLSSNAYSNDHGATRGSNRSSSVAPSSPEKLFAGNAVAALNQLLSEVKPQVVPMWRIRLLDREGFFALFALAGLNIKLDNLHPAWSAPETSGPDRRASVSSWIERHYRGEGLLILDSETSGATFIDTAWMKSGHVILCPDGVGFHADQLDAAHAALRRPSQSGSAWAAPQFEPDQRQRELIAEAERLSAQAMVSGHFVPPELERCMWDEQRLASFAPTHHAQDEQVIPTLSTQATPPPRKRKVIQGRNGG